MTDNGSPVILVVEDEQPVAESYSIWLEDRYDLRLAMDGQEALDEVDDAVDVVVLDRMLPGLSGREVLREIRDRELDCRVVMVTAVAPDFDVIEMGFDAYLTKPPTEQELVDTIEQLLDRATADDTLQEYYSLLARKSTLRAQKSEEELAGSEEYQELLATIERKRQEVDASLGDMGAALDFVGAVRELDRSERPADGDPSERERTESEEDR